MASLFDQLSQHVSADTINQIASQIGATPGQTKTAVSAAMPMLLGALARNSATPQGAAGILGALERDHDGSLLDSLGGLLGGASGGGGGLGDIGGMLGGMLGGAAPAARGGGRRWRHDGHGRGDPRPRLRRQTGQRREHARQVDRTAVGPDPAAPRHARADRHGGPRQAEQAERRPRPGRPRRHPRRRLPAVRRQSPGKRYPERRRRRASATSCPPSSTRTRTAASWTTS